MKTTLVACDKDELWRKPADPSAQLLARVDLITLNDGEARRDETANLVKAARWILTRGQST